MDCTEVRTVALLGGSSGPGYTFPDHRIWEAAMQDLKQQLATKDDKKKDARKEKEKEKENVHATKGQASSSIPSSKKRKIPPAKGKAKEKKKRDDDDDDDGDDEEMPAKALKETRKDGPVEDPDDDDHYKGPGDVPSPPSDPSSGGLSEGEEVGSPGPEDEGEGEGSDADIFKNEFAMDSRKTVVLDEAPKGKTGLSSKVEGVLETMDKSLVATFPANLSEPFCCTYLDSLFRGS